MDIGVVVILVIVLVASTSACKAPPGWRSFSLEERLYLFDIVVVGTDMKHTLIRNASDLGPFVDGEFKVSCVFKGDNRTINELITIKEVEPRHSCQHTEIEVGELYIAGLKRSEGDYMWHELNLQPAAFQYTDDNLMKAISVCGLQNPSPPIGVTGSCPEVKHTGPCTGRMSGGAGYLTHGWTMVISNIVVLFIAGAQV